MDDDRDDGGGGGGGCCGGEKDVRGKGSFWLHKCKRLFVRAFGWCTTSQLIT